MPDVRYDPTIFDCPTIEAARAVILTKEVGLSTDERWERETEWVKPFLTFDPGLVIDFGCGIGRLSKEIGHPVLGVDISKKMRAYAEEYVARDGFAAVSPTMMWCLVKSGMRASGAIAAWVLQHCEEPEIEIELLAEALLPGAKLFVLNRTNRCVPSVRGNGDEIEQGFAEDSRNVSQLLLTYFRLENVVEVPDTLCVPGAFAATYRRS